MAKNWNDLGFDTPLEYEQHKRIAELESKLDAILADLKFLRDCTDTEMGDGDAAREIAVKWLESKP